MKNTLKHLTLAAITSLGAACVTDETEQSSTTQAVINPGEAAQVVESSAGESLTMPTGPITLGVMEGVFKVKIAGVWSTVGHGLYHNVAEASCISPGRTSSPPNKVAYSKPVHKHHDDWTSWNDN